MQLACGRWYGFEKKMRRFQDRKELIVWAVLDCDRVQGEDFLYQGATDTCTEASVVAGDATTSQGEEEEKKSRDKHGSILTFAAEMGEVRKAGPHSLFCHRIGQFLKLFVFQGVQGTFNLRSCLKKIPRHEAVTEFNNLTQDVTIFAKKAH